MVKRSAVGLAWFLAVGWGLNLLSMFLDVPAWPGIVVALAAGIFFGADPLVMIWPRPALPVRDEAKPSQVGGRLAAPPWSPTPQ